MIFQQFLANEAARPGGDTSTVLAEVPDATAAKIKAWGEKNVPADALFQDPEDPTFGRENYPHVTVLGGIHTARPGRAKKLLGEEHPFEIEMGKMSLFRTGKFDVLKVEVSSATLDRLHHLLLDKLACTVVHKTFVPHLTIAYLKPGEGDEYDGHKAFSGKKFEVARLIFSDSTRAKTPIDLGA